MSNCPFLRTAVTRMYAWQSILNDLEKRNPRKSEGNHDLNQSRVIHNFQNILTHIQSILQQTGMG